MCCIILSVAGILAHDPWFGLLLHIYMLYFTVAPLEHVISYICRSQFEDGLGISMLAN